MGSRHGHFQVSSIDCDQVVGSLMRDKIMKRNDLRALVGILD